MNRFTFGLAALALVLAGCGNDDKTATVTVTDYARDKSSPVVYSQGARLEAGLTAQLDTPTIRIVITCGKKRVDVSVEARKTTSDAVIASSRGDAIQPELTPGQPLVVPMSVPDIQTWTISPFSAGETQPTTLTVGASAVQPESIYDCAVMAQAVVGEKVSAVTN